MIGTILLIVCKIFRHWLMTGPKPKTSRILLHLKSMDPRLLAKKTFWWIVSVADHKRNRQRKLNPFPCQFLTLVLHQQNNKISSLVLLGIPITIVIHASLNFHPCCLEMARKKIKFPSFHLSFSLFLKKFRYIQALLSWSKWNTDILVTLAWRSVSWRWAHGSHLVKDHMKKKRDLSCCLTQSHI